MRPMRFEDYVVARDDNSQQLDEAGIFDMIGKGVGKVKSMFGGGGGLAGRLARAKVQRTTTSEKQSKLNAELMQADKNIMASSLGEEKKQAWSNLKNVIETINDTADEMAKAPGQIIKLTQEKIGIFANAKKQIEDVLASDIMQRVPADDKRLIVTALGNFEGIVKSYAQAVQAQVEEIRGIQEQGEALSNTVVDMSKNLIKFYNDYIRELTGRTAAKVKPYEGKPGDYAPESGKTARSVGQYPRPTQIGEFPKQGAMGGR